MRCWWQDGSHVHAATENAQILTISPEKVCLVIGAKEEVTEPDPGSNPTDDGHAEILEDHLDDPVVEELTSLINSLSEEMSTSTSRHSRGSGGMIAPLPTGRQCGRRQPAHNERTAEYSLRMHSWATSQLEPEVVGPRTSSRSKA